MRKFKCKEILIVPFLDEGRTDTHTLAHEKRSILSILDVVALTHSSHRHQHFLLHILSDHINTFTQSLSHTHIHIFLFFSIQVR